MDTIRFIHQRLVNPKDKSDRSVDSKKKSEMQIYSTVELLIFQSHGQGHRFKHKTQSDEGSMGLMLEYFHVLVLSFSYFSSYKGLIQVCHVRFSKYSYFTELCK